MFYSQSLLSRKGPLGNIWVAAHCYKKLKKEQVTETNISSTIEKIIPDIQLSYRVLAHLLLGVVRIFSKKVDYLFHDCNTILIRLGETFLTGQCSTSKKATAAHPEVSIPKGATHGRCHSVALHEEGIHASIEAIRAAYHDITITLPKNFELDSFDLEVPDEDENARTHEQFRLVVEDEPNQTAFKSERYNDAMIARLDFCSGSFTPVEDVISSGVLDIDLEIGELKQASKLEARQRLQGDLPSLEECGNHSSARRSLKLNINSQELEEHVGQNELQQAKPSDPSDAPPEGYVEVRTPVNGHSKMSLLCASEAAAPEFAVATPAIKERHRLLRKRKCLFDETIVLSNKTLRQWIHDGSSLTCKRRKAPHTLLDAWKGKKISNIQNCLREPLIPCISFDLEDIFLDSSFVPSPQKKSVDPTHKSDFDKTVMLAETALGDRLLEKSSVEVPASESSADLTCQSNFEKNEMLGEPELRDRILEKPSVEVLPSVSSAEVPSSSKADEEIFESFSIAETSLIDKEFISLEGCENQDGWSTKTRSVAQYLCRCYEQEGKGALNLSKILKGRRRKNCAIFFYETLVLKSHGYVDVKQEFAFGDIIVSPTPEMKTMFRSDWA